jgi:hypothetical protein
MIPYKFLDAFQKVTNTVTNNMGNKIRKTKATTVKVISVAQANIGQNAASDESKNLKLNAPSSRFEVLSRIGSRSSPEKPTMETDEGIDEKKRANSITGTGISGKISFFRFKD